MNLFTDEAPSEVLCKLLQVQGPRFLRPMQTDLVAMASAICQRRQQWGSNRWWRRSINGCPNWTKHIQISG